VRGRGGQPGFTVLELLVVLGIIGMLTAGLVIGGRRIRKSDLRSAAGRVAATLRFAFDRAAATGAHHRVVIDLDAGQLHVERCEGKLRLRRGQEAGGDLFSSYLEDQSWQGSQRSLFSRIVTWAIKKVRMMTKAARPAPFPPRRKAPWPRIRMARAGKVLDASAKSQ